MIDADLLRYGPPKPPKPEKVKPAKPPAKPVKAIAFEIDLKKEFSGYVADFTDLIGSGVRLAWVRAQWLVRNLPAFWRSHARVALRHPLRWSGALCAVIALAWQLRLRDAGGARPGRRLARGGRPDVQAGHGGQRHGSVGQPGPLPHLAPALEKLAQGIHGARGARHDGEGGERGQFASGL